MTADDGAGAGGKRSSDWKDQQILIDRFVTEIHQMAWIALLCATVRSPETDHCCRRLNCSRILVCDEFLCPNFTWTNFLLLTCLSKGRDVLQSTSRIPVYSFAVDAVM